MAKFLSHISTCKSIVFRRFCAIVHVLFNIAPDNIQFHKTLYEYFSIAIQRMFLCRTETLEQQLYISLNRMYENIVTNFYFSLSRFQTMRIFLPILIAAWNQYNYKIILIVNNFVDLHHNSCKIHGVKDVTKFLS